MPRIPYKTKDGTRVCGVTTIIGNLGWNRDALMFWAWNEGTEGRNYRDTSQKAATAGTVAHYLIECDIKKQKPDLSSYPKELIKLATQSFRNYLEWKKFVRFEPRSFEETEVHLVSETYFFGGTPDRLADINGKLSLYDWKTSNGVYPEMIIQLETYRHLWDEVHPDNKIKGGLHLLRVGKEDASFHYHHWKAVPVAWKVFKMLLKIHGSQRILKRAI